MFVKQESCSGWSIVRARERIEGDKVKIRGKAGARTFGSLTAKVVVST